MKKIMVVIVALLVSVAAPFAAGCSNNNTATGTVLKISNWEDYIDESIIERFEEENDCTVEYSNFGTNENLYNDLKIAGNSYTYDLICPSDYMIEKMAKEGMLSELSLTDDSTYKTMASPYIQDIFETKITWDGKSLADYAAGYMWGTMGFVYNPETVAAEDMTSWLSLWDSKYKNKSTIKDSVRDSYFAGIAYAKKDELDALATAFKNGTKTAEAYNKELTDIFNDTSAETIALVEEGLKTLKNNIFGFEVDSGKNDMVTGKISINFAWSGDAVYAMNEAEGEDEDGDGVGEGKLFYYTVPDEGSNVWFDGWCIPKNAQQKELAVKFIEFLSTPEIAAINMEYIGYTSAISGDQDFSIDYYEYDKNDNPIFDTKQTVEYTGIYDWMIQTYGLETEVGEGLTEINLGYFFGGDDKVVYTDTVGRQFSAQYPTEDVIQRCVVMHYFDDEANEAINKMWENIKGQSFPVWAIILIVVGVLVIIGVVLLIKFKDNIFKGGKGGRGKKKGKVVSRENI